MFKLEMFVILSVVIVTRKSLTDRYDDIINGVYGTNKPSEAMRWPSDHPRCLLASSSSST